MDPHRFGSPGSGSALAKRNQDSGAQEDSSDIASRVKSPRFNNASHRGVKSNQNPKYRSQHKVLYFIIIEFIKFLQRYGGECVYTRNR